MRIVMFLRLFSGFESGFRDRCWLPKGAPTIARLIEELDAGPHELKLIFACHEHEGKWDCSLDQTFRIQGLKTEITILGGEKVFPRFIGRLRSRLAVVRHVFKVWRISHAFNADMIYVDRGNMWVATWLARLTSFPVVWRIMGVLPVMHGAITTKGWRQALMRFAFRSPFAHAICTLEGSSGGTWMDKALNPEVPRHLMINGIDWDSINALPSMDFPEAKSKTIVLFVGRLEDNKGCDMFLKAFANAASQVPNQLHAVVVGDGALFGSLQNFVNNNQELAQSATLVGAVSAQDVLKWHKLSDIYVSLNRMGNLSNANLEALACGACLVIPTSRPDEFVDSDTDQLIPRDVALRYGHVDDEEGLTQAIVSLHKNPQDRIERARKTQEFAQRYLPSWKARIADELEILETVENVSSSRK